MTRTRRVRGTRLARALALGVAALTLASCGSSTAEPAPVGGAAGADADGARFPQAVEHKYGTTTVAERPERIVIVGLTEQDTVLQLGYKPVATTEWYGDQPQAVWPWAREALGDSRPTVLQNADGLDVEKIASLRPDLILGVNSGMKRKDYEQLSRLAPTIPAGKGSTDYFSSWDQQVRLIAQALGKPEEGEALIHRVVDGYAEVAAEHPEFADKTITFSQNGFYNGELYVYPEGLGTDFLTMLGFEVNPRLTPLAQRPGEQVPISEERLDVIDADVIVFATEKRADIAALEKVPTFRLLGAVKGNRAVYADPTLSGAMYFLTPLSLAYILEKLPPELAKAVAGKAPRRLVGA